MSEYIIKNDEIKAVNNRISNSKMCKNNKEKYKYHLDVLPKPYFGDLKNADILFLAKNPSYDKFEDMYDTWLYITSGKKLCLSKEDDDYYEALSNVNIFDNFENDNNKLFFNAWKWWNKKVIGNDVKIIKNYKAAFINLCAYQSISFNESYYLKNSFIDEINLDKVKLFIFVWGYNEWKKELKETIITKKDFIILNNRQKITTIEQILNSEADARHRVIEKYFQKKSN